MAYFVSIVIFVLIFSLLILIHEWGHFYAARRAGVRVEEFGLGLPPKAVTLKTDKKGTDYTLNWIPFGGFVRMFGEDSGDAKLYDHPESFMSKTLWQRTIIVLGGVIMNFLLGFVLLTVLFSVGTKPLVVTQEDFQHYVDTGVIIAENQVMISGFADGSPAESAGILKNDQVLSVDGTEVNTVQSLIDTLAGSADLNVDLIVLREGEEMSLPVTLNDEKKMGVIIQDAPDIKEVKEIQLPVHQAVVKAGQETARLSWLTMKLFVNVIVDLFTKAELSEQVSGPVGIAQLTHQTTQEGDFFDILKLIALLSISLGAINVLPIPALDGGRFITLAYELITRKKPNPSLEAKIHGVGFIVLILLIFAVTYQDIVRIFAAN